MSGEWRWLREDVYVETLGPGRWRTVGVCIDITEVNQATEALQRQREFLRSVIDTDPNLIYVKDVEGVYSLANQALAQVYGTTVEAIIGKRDADFVSDADIVAGYRRADVETLTSLEETFIAEEPLPMKEGDTRWFQTVKRPIHSPDGNGYQVLGICTDITERKRLEAQLIHSGKLAALGELVAGVAHEINNPLSVISGHAQLLMLHADHAVREDGAIIQEMAQRMARLVRSLRSFARSCGETESTRQPTDLNKVVQSALDVTGGLLRSTDVTVNLDLADDLPLLILNPGEIEQVLVNLLSNAEHALRGIPSEQRRIIVRTQNSPSPSAQRLQESCVLSVEDTGCGMSPAIQERIFDPFFSTKDTGDGTGLGLYLSYGIVTSHGGMIHVSSSPNEGTTFTIERPRLPVDAAAKI